MLLLINRLKSVPKGTASKFGIPKPISKDPIIPNKKLRNYEPIDWNKYFSHSAIIDDKIPIYWKGESGPNIVCLHGAGHSAISFAPLCGFTGDKYRLISFDFRGHGFNTMSEGEDLSQETLINDTIRVLQYVNDKFKNETIIVLGHSMGGSIATKTVAEIFKNQSDHKEIHDKIQGLIVVDVVEGTAMEALPFMESIVKNRPSKFKSIEQGIEYMYKSGTIKRIESARISVPPLLKEYVDKKGETNFVWKTNLMSSQKYWTGINIIINHFRMVCWTN